MSTRLIICFSNFVDLPFIQLSVNFYATDFKLHFDCFEIVYKILTVYRIRYRSMLELSFN